MGDTARVRRSGITARVLTLAVLLGVAAQLGANSAPTTAGTGTLATWVQLGPAGRIFARAITTAPTCPRIVIDGRSEPMGLRAAPSLPAVPVLTCETRIPADAREASIDGQRLPLPHHSPQRVVVIGDTGCRITAASGSSHGHYQACNDPVAWPFARVAAVAAALAPDLVIHVGDYNYRESPCPAGNAGCAGPSGFTWAAWEADFFTPAAPLLRAAPWVFVRGNHEDCERSGPLWFRFLDPLPFTGGCEEMTDPNAIPLGELQLLLLDSAAAADVFTPDPMLSALYRPQFDALRQMAALANAPHTWLVTHAPLWAFGHEGEMQGVEQLFLDTDVLQEASDNALPDVALVLSGHIHLFELLDFGGERPSQVVVGNSGTALDPPITSSLEGRAIAGATVQWGLALDRFGFVTLEREGTRWRMTLRDTVGRAMLVCLTVGREVECGE